jgi:type VII secretion protein EccB
MPRFLTTKVQLSGYRLMIRRIEQAFIRNDVRLLASPFSAQTVAFSVGMFFAGLIVGIGLLMSIIQPRADQRNAEIIISSSGGLYVMYGERLHPVLNLASARLITGKPDTPKVVKDAALSVHPRGLTMGIPSAPENFQMRTDDTAAWTVCDQHTGSSTLSLTKTSDMTTTLFAGKDALSDAVTVQPDSEAILAKQVGQPDRLWIIYKQRKAEIYPQDEATKHALRISPEMERSAVPISQGLMDTINPAPALTVPYIPDRGVVNPLLPSVLTGDVMATKDSNGNRVFHVALANGMERIPEFLAQVLENTGSTIVTDAAAEKVASLPKVSDIDVGRFPDHAPKFTVPHVLCWKWSRAENSLSSSVEVLTGESLPLKLGKEGYLVELNKPTGTIVQANAAYTDPGKGWFVRVTGEAPESQAREQLMWIDDTGVRYFLGLDDQKKYDRTVEALGLNTRNPLLVPWSIAKLYAQGPTLSRENALTLHVNIPVDESQRAITPDEDQQARARHG